MTGYALFLNLLALYAVAFAGPNRQCVFQIAPDEGRAPLKVYLYITQSPDVPTNLREVKVDFGEGPSQVSPMVCKEVYPPRCSFLSETSHIYERPGTYLVQIDACKGKPAIVRVTK